VSREGTAPSRLKKPLKPLPFMAVIFYLGPAFTPDHRAYRDKNDLNKFMRKYWPFRRSSNLINEW